MKNRSVHDQINICINFDLVDHIGPVNSGTVWKHISMPIQDRILSVERAMDIEASRIAWEFEDYDE